MEMEKPTKNLLADNGSSAANNTTGTCNRQADALRVGTDPAIVVQRLLAPENRHSESVRWQGGGGGGGLALKT